MLVDHSLSTNRHRVLASIPGYLSEVSDLSHMTDELAMNRNSTVLLSYMYSSFSLLVLFFFSS